MFHMKNLLRRIQLKWMPSRKAFKDLQQQLEVLEIQLLDRAIEFGEENDNLTERAKTGIPCIEAVLGRGIDYYDPSKLEYAEQVAYKDKAKEVLKNETFLNEIRHLEANWVEFCAKGAKTFEEVNSMRMCINALELLQERLNTIPDPRKPKMETDPFEII